MFDVHSIFGLAEILSKMLIRDFIIICIFLSKLILGYIPYYVIDKMKDVENSSDTTSNENNDISCNEAQAVVHPFLRKLQTLNRQRIQLGFDQEDMLTYIQVKSVRPQILYVF